MNANIEVINENLWAVNSEWVQAGMIEDLTPIAGSDTNNPYVSLTNDGVLILKKESEFYPIFKKFLPKIMKLSDEDLRIRWDEMKNETLKDGYDRINYDSIRWELKRRKVRREYLEKQKEQNSLKGRIKKFLKKGR